MFPVRDSQATRRITPANTLILVANAIIFGFALRMGPHAAGELSRFAMVPAEITEASSFQRELSAIGTLVTSTFLHAGILHLAANMLYLFIFGAAIEERLGHARFLAFYLAAGVFAGLATIAADPGSRVAVVGASGAIAGVLGAYLALFPASRIITILPFRTIEVPAIFYLLIWFALQLYSGLASAAIGAPGGGIAWSAHIGGFLFGLACGPLVAKRPPRRRRR
jgi:membrane associated rhomboid family serine protease